MNEYKNTERWDKWIADGGKTIGDDTDLSLIIPKDLGVGVTTYFDRLYWTSTREYGGMDKDYLKKVTLEISTWVSISVGATHYYGKLMFKSPIFVIGGSDRHLLPSSDAPQFLQPAKIILTRNVNQSEIDDNPSMWAWQKAGEQTERFSTIQEVIDRGTEIFDQWFEKGWILELKKSWSNNTEILRK